jgi:hypothetical protein
MPEPSPSAVLNSTPHQRRRCVGDARCAIRDCAAVMYRVGWGVMQIDTAGTEERLVQITLMIERYRDLQRRLPARLVPRQSRDVASAPRPLLPSRKRRS